MARRRSQPVYFETVRDGLVTCKVLDVGDFVVTVKITARTHPVYKKGEVVTTTKLHVVHKAGRRGYTQYVRQVFV